MGEIMFSQMATTQFHSTVIVRSKSGLLQGKFLVQRWDQKFRQMQNISLMKK